MGALSFSDGRDRDGLVADAWQRVPEDPTARFAVPARFVVAHLQRHCIPQPALYAGGRVHRHCHDLASDHHRHFGLEAARQGVRAAMVVCGRRFCRIPGGDTAWWRILSLGHAVALCIGDGEHGISGADQSTCQDGQLRDHAFLHRPGRSCDGLSGIALYLASHALVGVGAVAFDRCLGHAGPLSSDIGLCPRADRRADALPLPSDWLFNTGWLVDFLAHARRLGLGRDRPRSCQWCLWDMAHGTRTTGVNL